MTHVKRNSQNIRGFTKPSHIECAVQFSNKAILPTHNFNCKIYSKEKGYYPKKRFDAYGTLRRVF